VVAEYHAAPGGPEVPTYGTVAGVALREADALVGKLGNPIGIDCYRPYQSTGEDFIHNYFGMIGIPINLHPEFPTEAKLVLLTEDARGDPDIVAKIKGQLTAGKTVVITSGLLRALKGKGIESICETGVTDNKVLSSEFTTGLFSPVHAHSAAPILFPQVSFLTNDAWGLVSAIEGGTGYPIILMDKYSKGSLFVWTIPDVFANLYALPQEVTTAIRDTVMSKFFVRADGPSKVALFAYDNNTFVLENYRPEQVQMKVTIDGTYSKLRNLVTGEVIASFVPEPPRGFFRRSPRDEAPRSHFMVPVLPHSIAAFEPEK
jgi:hypothetical protein